ncbi:63 kDa sperm flagellar membrane protein-like [Amphiura filiformis]|uniref:63 kDa sperm flagellar membrane protein-like n=1 Tax=Amphiura filiformis TaxID=82378 RepID=UPI003B227BC7
MLKWVVFLAAVALAVAVPQTGIRKCFTCERADSSEECNGAHLDHSTSPHGNGTLHTCLFDNPTCFYQFKMNAAQTGERISKGCMDYEECMKTYMWQWDDFNLISCFFGNPDIGPQPQGLNITAWPNAECIYCCALWQQGYNNQFFDGCNVNPPTKLPQLLSNNWDDAVDSWDIYPSKVVQVEPPGYADSFKRSGAQRHLFEVTVLVAAISIAGASSF